MINPDIATYYINRLITLEHQCASLYRCWRMNMVNILGYI